MRRLVASLAHAALSETGAPRIRSYRNTPSCKQHLFQEPAGEMKQLALFGDDSDKTETTRCLTPYIQKEATGEKFKTWWGKSDSSP